MSIHKSWRAAVVAAIVTFSVIAGTVGSYAYWSATASATLGAGAASLTSTSTGWAATTLGNENVSATSSNSLTSTGSITFTNTTTTTSSSSQTLNAVFTRASGSTTLASATTLTVWPAGPSGSAACTTSATPTGATSGTWMAGVTVSTTLAPGASIVYCLRNTIVDRQNADDASGTLTFTPQVAAELRAGTNFTATQTTTSSIATRYIYPLANISAAYWYYVIRVGTNWCWDVSGSGTASGTALISYECKNNGDLNQDWRFVDADGDGYGDIQPRNATALRIQAAASTVSGSAVDMRTAATTTTVQQWQEQLVGTNTFQYVNKFSGLCLSAPAASTGVMTQVTCTGTADQQFTLTKRAVIQIPIACAPTGTNGNRTATYTWTPDYAAGPYTIKTVSPSNVTTTLVASTTATSYTIPAPIGAPFTGATGAYDIQILNSSGEVLATDTFNVTRQFVVTGYYYGTC